MTDLPTVTEGRAYHRGDVVFIRLKVEVPLDTYRLVAEGYRELQERTGVEVVLLGPQSEIVEPREIDDPGPLPLSDWRGKDRND